MNTPAENITRVIRDALDEHGISVREAAERTGIPLPTLARRLAGHEPLTVTDLANLAYLTGSTAAEVVAQAEPQPPA